VLPVLEPNTKRSKIVFFINSIVLTLTPLGAELLQFSAQSLIGSPGTLVPITAATWNSCVSIFFVTVVSVSRREVSPV